MPDISGLFAAVGIEMATKDNVDWLLHIDTDELMYPGGNAGFSLQNVLSTFADEVDTVVFPNYESLPETDKVHDPFTEVILQAHGAVQCSACNALFPSTT